MTVYTHSDQCQMMRWQKELEQLNSSEKLCELEPYMRQWAEDNGLKQNALGMYAYCTCDAVKKAAKDTRYSLKQ